MKRNRALNKPVAFAPIGSSSDCPDVLAPPAHPPVTARRKFAPPSGPSVTTALPSLNRKYWVEYTNGVTPEPNPCVLVWNVPRQTHLPIGCTDVGGKAVFPDAMLPAG